MSRRRFFIITVIFLCLSRWGDAAIIDPCSAVVKQGVSTSLLTQKGKSWLWAGLSRTIQVVSYNVAGFYQDLPDGGMWAPLLKKGGWAQNVPAGDNAPYIAKLLTGYDVVFLQENWSYYDALAQGLTVWNACKPIVKGHQFRTVPSFTPAMLGVTGLADWDDFKDNPTLFDEAVNKLLATPELKDHMIGHGLGVYSRLSTDSYSKEQELASKGKYNLVPESEKWDECNGNDCLTGKGFLRDRLNVVSSGGAEIGKVCIYNYHANAGFEKAEQEVRRKQHEQLAADILAHCAADAMVVIGDTNLQPSLTYDMETLDLFKKMIELQDARDAGVNPAPTVDHIFYRSGKGVQIVLTKYDAPQGFLNPETGQPLSDHPPIAATIKIIKSMWW